MQALEGVTIAVIGAGNIGGILLERLRAVGKAPEALVVFDTDAAKARAAAGSDGTRVAAGPLAPELWGADIVLLAVPPPAILGVVEAAAPVMQTGQILVSFAAGVRLEWLEEALPAGVGAARVMPNAPSRVGLGFNPVCWGRRTADPGRERVRAVLAALGETVEVPEEQLGWWVGLSGAALRSLLPVLEGMVDAGLEAGLDPTLARRAAVRQLQGTAALVEADPRPLDELKALTPMETLDEPVVRRTFHEAARGARDRVAGLEAKLAAAVSA